MQGPGGDGAAPLLHSPSVTTPRTRPCFPPSWLPACSEMFSVNHFIVSQTNPHVVPFLHLKRQLGTPGAVAESEFKHR